ncbi:DapH/DapD/GlmU-related protein [Flavobacterium sharifuzzamanii]|uniref:DapH/DapD/GlmU-related protein n=1 Tax=Flavobacterium sharifuzzamanii TaxID=2211133 RepID=UPI000DADAAC3|nr:DapH/DapD/GlmU-related protein [Flavobacterium sharifuzzamanii]KAF2081152.1 acyltransferase [Flavobacterium sharifuzzamanii]
MKKIIINGIANVSLILFPLKFLVKIKNVFNSIYTARILKGLKEASNGSIKYPMYLKGGEYIKIGNNFDCDQRLRLDAIDNFLGEKFYPEIIIGNNVSIQKDCHIGAINKIILGDNVLLASKVYISDHSHGEITKEALLLPPSKRKLYSKSPVIIEDNVWLGENVVVLPGVTIGENTVVGANAVVTKSIPKNSVVGGNPARVIREL